MAATIGATSIGLRIPEEAAPRRTYITFGLERGGTSAVAGVQRALGLDLGPTTKGNNEDGRFKFRRLAGVREVIKQRNDEFDVWGVKIPTLVQRLPALEDSFRNPFYIVVNRDPVSVAMSRSNWDGKALRRETAAALHEASTGANANMSFALMTRRPVLLVSNEKVERNPSGLIDDIADFLFVPRPDEAYRQRILEYLAPGSYKKFEDFFADIEPIGRRS